MPQVSAGRDLLRIGEHELETRLEGDLSPDVRIRLILVLLCLYEKMVSFA